MESARYKFRQRTKQLATASQVELPVEKSVPQLVEILMPESLKYGIVLFHQAHWVPRKVAESNCRRVKA